MSAVPVITWSADPPLNKISPVPEYVALFVTFPFTVIVFPPSAKVPALTTRLPAMVIAAETVFVLAPDNVRFPYVEGPKLELLPATVMALVEL